jgi:hypothetical protein
VTALLVIGSVAGVTWLYRASLMQGFDQRYARLSPVPPRSLSAAEVARR